MHSFSFWSHLFKMWDWKFFPWQKGGTNIVPPLSKLKFFDTPKQNPNPILETDAWNDLAKKFLQAIVLLPCSAANKGWSMVSYHQSLTFERPYFCQVMIIVTSGFSKKSFLLLLLFPRSSLEQSWTFLLGI